MARLDLSGTLGNNGSYIKSQLPNFLSGVYNEAINEFDKFKGIDKNEISRARDRFNGWVRYSLDMNKKDGRMDVDRFTSTLKETLPEIIKREDFAVVTVLGDFIDEAVSASHQMRLQRAISPYLVKRGKMQQPNHGESYEGIPNNPFVDSLLTREEAFDVGHQVLRFVEHNVD